MIKLYPFLGCAVAVVCVACGASFSANEGAGPAGAGSSGDASGGSPSAAGSSSAGDAGELEVGGTGAAGEGSKAGAGGTVTGVAGASAGHGGSSSGGRSGGTGGGSTTTDCATLEQEYRAAVEKARVCDKGSSDECSPSSAAEPVGGCGCPVLINAKSEYAAAAKKAYQAYQSNKCGSGGPVCNVFCAPAATASCAQQTTGSGNAFVCSAGAIVQN